MSKSHKCYECSTREHDVVFRHRYLLIDHHRGMRTREEERQRKLNDIYKGTDGIVPNVIKHKLGVLQFG